MYTYKKLEIILHCFPICDCHVLKHFHERIAQSKKPERSEQTPDLRIFIFLSLLIKLADSHHHQWYFIIMQYPVEIDPLFVFISNQLRWDLRWNSRGTKNQIPQTSLWSGIIVIRFHKGEIPIIRLNESLGSFNCFICRVNKVNCADSGLLT